MSLHATRGRKQVNEIKMRHVIRRKRSAIVVMLGVMLLGAAFHLKNSRGYTKQHEQYVPLLSSITATDIKDPAVPDEIDANAEDTTIRHSGNKSTSVVKEINLRIEDDHEPYLNRWQRRFASSKARNKKGGYLFFKHIRKAGGTSLRDYFRDVLAYHNITRNIADWRAIKNGPPINKHQIHYVEHEFQTMDWQCPTVDPRWRESMRIIVLRHPIERHLSEFFFSGGGKKFLPVDKQRLSNETYSQELASFLSEQVPKWMNHIGKKNTTTMKGGIEGKFNMVFGRHYADNFQLRALAGCSSGDCLKEKNVTKAQMENIDEFHPSLHSYSDPVPVCTNFFRIDDAPVLFEQCAKPQNVKEHCSMGCDGPCFYPSVAWGEMKSQDVTRAVNALKEFDAVLLMEKLDDQDQSDFLSDVLGVPRDAEFSLANRGSIMNIQVEKKSKREKSRFYRDLLSKLGLKDIQRVLHNENKLEMEFFGHAEKLNAMMIDQWKRENMDT